MEVTKARRNRKQAGSCNVEGISQGYTSYRDWELRFAGQKWQGLGLRDVDQLVEWLPIDT